MALKEIYDSSAELTYADVYPNGSEGSILENIGSSQGIYIKEEDVKEPLYTIESEILEKIDWENIELPEKIKTPYDQAENIPSSTRLSGATSAIESADA